MLVGAYVTNTFSNLISILQVYANSGRANAPYCLYVVPSAIVAQDITTDYKYHGQTAPVEISKSVGKETAVNGYIPKNKKLLTFPYNYLVISNNNGSSNILHYERFTQSNCTFKIKGVPTVGCSIKLIPTHYDSGNNEEENGIMAGKFPTLNWSKDEFTNWLTQNAVNIGLGVASAGISLATGIGMVATGNPIGGGSAIVSSGMQIANEVGAVYEHSLQPNSARGNVNGGDINVCSSCNGFYVLKYSIKNENARIIDDYFTKFGYKINRVKVPNINSRTYWNYLKTIDCTFDGAIPNEDMDKIRNIFDNGITLWHNPSYIYDYSRNNTIVTP